MMKKRLMWLIPVSLFIFLLVFMTVRIIRGSGKLTSLKAPVSAGKPLIPLRVVVLPYLTFAPLYIADDEGYFAEQGLKVEFVKFQRNGDSLPALLRGEVDIDSIFTVGLLNAIGRGEKVRVVANKGVLLQNGCTAEGFLVRTALAGQISGMSAIELRKLSFGVDPTWVDSYLLQQLLAKRGVKLSEVRTQYLPDPAARIEALRQGALDVIFLSEPWITRAKQSGAGDVWVPAAEIAPGYPLGIISFGPSLLKRKDDVGARFLRAYLQGIAQYAKGKTPRNIEILSKATRLDADLLTRICWPAFALDGRIEARAISAYSSWIVMQGLAGRALSPEEFWDPTFISAAGETPNVKIPAKP
jgi:NitT/TauT family transport system substrate-binding protein